MNDAPIAETPTPDVALAAPPRKGSRLAFWISLLLLISALALAVVVVSQKYFG